LVDGVRDAAYYAAVCGGELVARQPVVDGLQHREHREEHRDVRLRGAPDLRSRRLEDDAAGQDVRRHHEHCDEQHRDEQPVEDERDERQAEQVEADVVAEAWVLDAERLAVAEHQPVLPARHRRRGEQEAEQHRDTEAQEPQPAAEELVEALDDGMRVRREARGCEPIGDDEVEHGERNERAGEHEEQGELRPQHAPEHVGSPD